MTTTEVNERRAAAARRRDIRSRKLEAGCAPRNIQDLELRVFPFARKVRAR